MVKLYRIGQQRKYIETEYTPHCLCKYFHITMFVLACLHYHFYITMFILPCLHKHFYIIMFILPCLYYHVYTTLVILSCLYYHIYIIMFILPWLSYYHVYIVMFTLKFWYYEALITMSCITREKQYWVWEAVSYRMRNYDIQYEKQWYTVCKTGIYCMQNSNTPELRVNCTLA